MGPVREKSFKALGNLLGVPSGFLPFSGQSFRSASMTKMPLNTNFTLPPLQVMV